MDINNQGAKTPVPALSSELRGLSGADSRRDITLNTRI